tara:strand:+ start:65 stop:982 length:918 start_codon:yes stop_codon:yes gene_type:complete
MEDTRTDLLFQIDNPDLTKFGHNPYSAGPVISFIIFLVGLFFVFIEMTEGNFETCFPYLLLCAGSFLGIIITDSNGRGKAVERYTNWKLNEIKKYEPSKLFKELEMYTKLLKEEYSTTTEQVVVGKEKVDLGIWGETSKNVYGSRTRENPEYKVMEKLLETEPSFYEKEILRRGDEIIPSIVEEWKSGKNSIILERIMKKMNVKKIGKQMETFHLQEEAKKWYEQTGQFEDGKNVSDKMKVKIDQTVVQGDQITKTEIKDSVLNRSNVGSSGDDKLTKIKELKELHDAGAIDDDEFKQMKKEIIG